jgi:hypothetical protein
MTSSRKPPHCKACHKPRKGHKRGICDLNDMPSSTTIQPSCAVNATTQKSAPFERLPTLSTESSQILNDILRANSRSASLVHVPEVKRAGRRRSGRRGELDELLRAAYDCLPADNEKEQKPSEGTLLPLKRDELGELPVAEAKESLPVQSQTSTHPSSTSCIVSQQLVVKASNTGSTLDPLTITMCQKLKLEDSTRGATASSQQQFSASDVPSAELTIQNFLVGMARNPEHPPSTIFSYPVDGIVSLKESVKSHGLCMHVLSLPKEKWVPVVIGRDTEAIKRLLEDGETLAQGLRRPDKFKAHEFDLSMSHVVVGALGALATWAGLAYS